MNIIGEIMDIGPDLPCPEFLFALIRTRTIQNNRTCLFGVRLFRPKFPAGE
jgi:hypothetical protein